MHSAGHLSGEGSVMVRCNWGREVGGQQLEEGVGGSVLSAGQVSVAAALKGLLQQMPTVTNSGSIHEQVIRQLPCGCTSCPAVAPVACDDWPMVL